MRTLKNLGRIAIVFMSIAFIFAGCKSGLITDVTGNTGPGVEVTTGVNGVRYAEVKIDAYNQAVDLASRSRSILPQVGNSIYFTIIGSTRKYDKAAYGATSATHTALDGHADYAADADVTTSTDANGDGYADGMDLAVPFFATSAGIPATPATFTIKTNQQWYFTAYGTVKAPSEYATEAGLDIAEAATWNWAEWTTMVELIQHDAKIVGDLPLYIWDDANSITLYDTEAKGKTYTSLSIEAKTQDSKPGHFLIPISLPQVSETFYQVKKVVLKWNGTNTDGDTVDETVSYTVPTPASASNFAFYPETDAGTYDVSVSFLNAEDKEIFAIAEDTLTVWGDIDSTVIKPTSASGSWYGTVSYPKIVTADETAQNATGSPSEEGYILKESDFRNFHRTRFYVSNGTRANGLPKATANANGSIFAPFAKIQDALDVIQGPGEAAWLLNSNTLWYIIVDGDYTDGDEQINIINPAGSTGGDYKLVIQSYKKALNKEASFAGTLNVDNKVADSSTSALKVVLRNIKLTGAVNVGTEHLILDNAKLTGTTYLLKAVDGTRQNGILNVSKSELNINEDEDSDGFADYRTKVDAISSTIANPNQVTVLRSYTIDYSDYSKLKPYHDITKPATYLTDGENWDKYFILADNYAKKTGKTIRELGMNTTNNDKYLGCQAIKTPASVAIEFEKGLYASSVLSTGATWNQTVDGGDGGWVITPSMLDSGSFTLTFVITVNSLSPNTPEYAANYSSVLSNLASSVVIKDAASVIVPTDSGAYSFTAPVSADTGSNETTATYTATVTFTGDIIDEEISANRKYLWFMYTVNGMNYSDPYNLVFKNAD